MKRIFFEFRSKFLLCFEYVDILAPRGKWAWRLPHDDDDRYDDYDGDNDDDNDDSHGDYDEDDDDDENDYNNNRGDDDR